MGVHVTFADGPLADAKHDRALNCAPPAAMWLAPQPIDDEPRTHDGWMLVGLGDRVPEIPYPGQVRYDLDEDAAGARAVYRQAGSATGGRSISTPRTSRRATSSAPGR